MIAPSTYVSTCTFRDADGVLFSPTTVTASVTRPDASVTVYSTANVYPPVGLTNPSTGVFKLKIDCTDSGWYYVTWYGQGSSGFATELTDWKI